MDSSISQKILDYYNSKLKDTHLRALLADEIRNQALVIEHDGVLLDYTHEKVDENVVALFEQLGNTIFDKIDAIFTGQKWNTTEGRAVLHVALRSSSNQVINVDGQNQVPLVQEVLERVCAFSDNVRYNQIKGHTGKNLTTVVVIGIGGSYLGIEFVYEALRTQVDCLFAAKGRQLKFLANVDPVDFQRTLENVNPENVLFIISSKTFTTAETMMNARACRQWLLDQYAKLGAKPEDEKSILSSHFCAVSTNLVETSKFGISDDRVFGFWDWVGGRFSVTSAIGMLPLSLQFGFQNMMQFLDGAHAIDQHFQTTREVSKNIPLTLGLLGWYRATIQRYNSVALIPYAQCLLRFPAHIQQVAMESNGKQTQIYKTPSDFGPYCPLIFGEPGTNSQHSFFQLIHQGNFVVPAEFIGYARSQAENAICTTEEEKARVRDQHDELMSNYFAQVDALARGKSADECREEGVKEELIAHKIFPGDRSSLQILFSNEANAYNIGQLLAIYEHRVLVEGLLWGINSFDQWGVELGKVLAKNVRQVLKKNLDPTQDMNFDGFNVNSATKNLIAKYRSFQQ